METYNLAYAQGLAYAWARNDAENSYWPTGGATVIDSVQFAQAWAELCSKNSSRPDLSGAYYAFRDGRPLIEGRKPIVARGKSDPLAVYCRYCDSYPTHCCVTKEGFETNAHKVRRVDAAKLEEGRV